MGRFEKWYDLNYIDSPNNSAPRRNFKRLNFSMQWGIYLEFFDSRVINCTIEVIKITHSEWIGWAIRINDELIEHQQCNTRPEAQKIAIVKAFELLNNI